MHEDIHDYFRIGILRWMHHWIREKMLNVIIQSVTTLTYTRF